jgi:ribokinase
MGEAQRIVVVGVFVADAAFRCERLPALGETLIGDGFQLGPGGKGSNQAVAAAKAGGDVALVARIGRDAFAAMGRAVWAEAGVTPRVIEDADRATGAAGIFIEAPTGRNAIVISPGAAAALSPADIEAQAQALAAARVVLTQLEQPVETARRALEIGRAGGAVTVLNPAPAAALPAGMLSLCDYVTPNEAEAQGLTGIAVTGLESAEAAAAALMAQGVAKAAVVTLGESGALVHDGRKAWHVPPMSAGPAVDTTGAGDAFNGGFAVGLAEGMHLEAALRLATATAALSVTRHGTAAAMPDRAAIRALLN